MANNSYFYEDKSRIPWFEINSSNVNNNTIDLAETTNNEQVTTPITPDDSVIFVKETKANDENQQKRKSVNSAQNNSMNARQLSAKIQKKYKKRKSLLRESSTPNNSEIIILDESMPSPAKQSPCPRAKCETSADESVIFVSETPAKNQFIPLSLGNGFRSPPKKKTKKVLSKIMKTKKKAQSAFIKELLTATAKKTVLKDVKKTVVPPPQPTAPSQKRMVLVDGSNVAHKHSNDEYFSVDGLKICLEYFEKRGYYAKAVVPQFRFRKYKTNNPTLLEQLKSEGKIIVTPSKHLPGNFSCSYDDRCIIQMACEMDAAIISNDNYRDLLDESEDFKKVIESRVIGYYWCDNNFMLPQDPYGRKGPTLNEILSRL